MAKVAEIYRYRGAAKDLYSWGWFYGTFFSTTSWEPAQRICQLAHFLGECIFGYLPCLDGQTLRNAGTSLKSWYREAQLTAHAIEAHVNPRAAEFGSDRRRVGMIGVARPALRAAGRRFLAAFDKIYLHYGWQDDTSRAASPEGALRQLQDLFSKEGNHSIMESEPPAIRKSALRALHRAADAYLTEAIKAMPHRLSPSERKVLVKATLPLTTQGIVIGLLFSHPDWPDAQIAKAAAISRGHLYKVPGYKDARARIKQHGKAEHPRGERFIDRETGSREVDGHVTDDRLEALMDDDE
jgi:hypothetical protein